MSIGFEADRSIVGINEPVRLTVVARNDSSAVVQSVHIEIMQVCTWYARGDKESKTRTVASMTVPVSQLGQIGRAEERDLTGRKPADVADAARNYLREILAAGAGTICELSAPDGSLLTLQTNLIDVRHSLNVRLKTSAFISSPEVSMPLCVQAETVELGTPPEANIAGLPTAEAVPYAATMRAEPARFVQPVAVPQSAVTMEFGSELPQPSASAKGRYHL